MIRRFDCSAIRLVVLLLGIAPQNAIGFVVVGFSSNKRKIHTTTMMATRVNAPNSRTAKTTTSTVSPLSLSTIPLGDLSQPNDQKQQQQKKQLLDVGSSPSSVFGSPLDDDTKIMNKKLVTFLKKTIFDNVFGGTTVENAYARFYALETIARMPYFSYVSVLHLFETLGMWRKAQYLKVHFAEAWNEHHHLLIMEELGGNQRYLHRFVAQHVAFFYFWIVVALYIHNPTMAYNLNQAIEEEAFQTYDRFIKTHGEYLKGQPAPMAAVQYYTGQDLYLFDEMHTTLVGANKMISSSTTSGVVQHRRPKCDTLYDSFVAIRDDEWEHVKTMEHLQQE